MKNFSSKVKAKVKAKEICCFFVCLFVFGLVLCAMIDLIDWFKKCRVDDYWVSGWVSEWVSGVGVGQWDTITFLFFGWRRNVVQYSICRKYTTRQIKFFFHFFFFFDRFNLMSLPHEKEKNTHIMLRHLSSRTD